MKGEVSIENIIKISSGFTLHGSNVKCVYDFSPDLWKMEHRRTIMLKGKKYDRLSMVVLFSYLIIPEEISNDKNLRCIRYMIVQDH